MILPDPRGEKNANAFYNKLACDATFILGSRAHRSKGLVGWGNHTIQKHALKHCPETKSLKTIPLLANTTLAINAVLMA